jgi:hypothetical protein
MVLSESQSYISILLGTIKLTKSRVTYEASTGKDIEKSIDKQ